MSEPERYSDAEAWEFYNDPANREPAPDAVVVERGPLPRSIFRDRVPVVFSHETIDAVEPVATAEGVSVSVWIRRVVDAELRRRTESTAQEPTVSLGEVRRALYEALDDVVSRSKGAAG